MLCKASGYKTNSASCKCKTSVLTSQELLLLQLWWEAKELSLLLFYEMSFSLGSSLAFLILLGHIPSMNIYFFIPFFFTFNPCCSFCLELTPSCMPDLLKYMEYMHHNSAQIPPPLWRCLYFLTTAILKLNYGGSDGKESACNAGDLGLIPGWGRCPGEGTGNALQYSCLGNPMSGGTWQATVHGIAKSQMRLSY